MNFDLASSILIHALIAAPVVGIGLGLLAMVTTRRTPPDEVEFEAVARAARTAAAGDRRPQHPRPLVVPATPIAARLAAGPAVRVQAAREEIAGRRRERELVFGHSVLPAQPAQGIDEEDLRIAA